MVGRKSKTENNPAIPGNDWTERCETGQIGSLLDIRGLVKSATSFEEKRAHETAWNQKVHVSVIAAAIQAT